MDLVQDIHSILRWGILAVAVAGLVHSLLNLSQGSSGSPRPHRTLASIFVGLLDLQLLLGGAILIWVPASRQPGLPHVLVMLAAVVMAHLLRVQGRKATQTTRGRVGVALFAVPLGMVLVGIALLA